MSLVAPSTEFSQSLPYGSLNSVRLLSDRNKKLVMGEDRVLLMLLISAYTI